MSSNRDSVSARAGNTRASGEPTFAEQSSKVAEDLRVLGHAAMNSAGEAIQHAKERGGESLEHGRERVEAARDGIERYVADNPLKSVLIAAGVGALIGFGMHRRG